MSSCNGCADMVWPKEESEVVCIHCIEMNQYIDVWIRTHYTIVPKMKKKEAKRRRVIIPFSICEKHMHKCVCVKCTKKPCIKYWEQEFLSNNKIKCQFCFIFKYERKILCVSVYARALWFYFFQAIIIRKSIIFEIQFMGLLHR